MSGENERLPLLRRLLRFASVNAVISGLPRRRLCSLLQPTDSVTRSF